MTASHSSRFRAPWKIFWVGLALRVACIVIGHTYRVPAIGDHFHFGFEMGRIARSLVLGQGYANPFNGPSGPTAWVPPLYPLLIAASFRLFGIYTNAAALFLLVCNSVFSAAIAPAVYEIAARCFDAQGIARRRSQYAEPVALWSSWLWAVYPAAMQYAIHWLWEMSLSTCLFTWAFVLALRLRGTSEGPGSRAQGSEGGDDAGSLDAGPRTLNPRFGTWVAFGVLWGLEGLSNASLLICLPAMVTWIVWPGVRKPRMLVLPVAGAALACVVFAAVMAPWVIRNERALHAFIPTRTNFGAELYESTLPSHDAMPWGTSIPLWTGDPEFKRFVKLGEVEYSREQGDAARARIRADEGQFWRWTLDRFLFFWDGAPHPPDRHPMQELLRQLSYSFLSLCGLLGMGLALKRRVHEAGLIALMFVLVPLPYYLVTVQPRFRHPLEPLIAVLGVYLFRSTAPRRKATANAEDAEEKRGERGRDVAPMVRGVGQ